MGWGAACMIVFGCIFAIGGFLQLTNATTGVGWLCVACFLAILGRIGQAESQHKQLLEHLGKRSIV